MRRTIVVAAVLLALLLVAAAARVTVSVFSIGGPPDWIADGTDAHGDPLPEGAVARLGTVRFRTTTGTNLLWLSDGRIASGGLDEEIVIWDARTGKRAQVLAGHRGSFVAPADRWSWRDVRDAVLHGSPPTLDDQLGWGHLAQDGDRLISAGVTIREWDLRTGAGRLVAWPRGGSVGSFVLRDDGRVLEYDWGERLRRFDLTTGEELERVALGVEEAHFLSATSPDGVWRAGYNVEGGITLVNTTDGSVRAIAAPVEDAFPRVVSFSPDGTRLWCLWNRKGRPEELAVRHSRLVAFDVRSGAETARIVLDDPGQWWLAAVSPDGRLLVAATIQGHLELRDAASHEVLRVFDASPAGIQDLEFSPDSRRLALRVGGRAVSFIDLDTGERSSVPDAHEGAVLTAVFVDAQHVVTAGSDGVLRAWEARSGRAFWERRWSGVAVPAPAPQGNELAVATHEGLCTIRTIDGEVVSAGQPPGPGMRVLSAAPDGTLLLRSERAFALVAPDDDLPRDIVDRGVPSDAMDGTRTDLVGRDALRGRVLVEDGRRTRTGERSWRTTHSLRLVDETQDADIWVASGERGDVAAFSGELTAVGTEFGKLRVFDAKGVALPGFVSPHADRSGPFGISALAFSRDGARLASGGEEHVVHVWSVPDGALLRTLRGHGGHVLDVGWSPDGTLLVSSSEDTSALVWDVAD